MHFPETIKQIIDAFDKELSSIEQIKELDAIKISYLGKKGKIAQLMFQLKDLSNQEKPIFGKKVNEAKKIITEKLTKKQEALVFLERSKLFEKEWIDPTLPGRKKPLGSIHPITQMLNRVLEILKEMGFSVQYGPDIETDYYNFKSLNFEEDHPARDMQDTFYISTDMLLRTHTSNVQTHVLEKHKPPIRIVAPGKCFRNETISARSHVFFHQVEGFYIDEDVSFADLLYTMEVFWKKLLGKQTKMQFRPSYFPFVEPGLEVDISCSSCKSKGCRICKYTGWLEVAGAGLVHPNVLRSSGLDPEKFSGYAWGMGIERLALLEFGITDIRMFTENDLRFLHQLR